MSKCFFLTGTDTNSGKTVASCALLQAAACYGYKTIGYKPVSSGKNSFSIFKSNNSDIEFLKKNSVLKLRHEDINPFSFSKETSPHIASKLENKSIDFQVMTKRLEKLKKIANLIVIEGAGGWHTPLSFKKNFSDWVVELKLPVILVVGMKLGCINHAMLTETVIKKSGVFLAGWISNEIEDLGKYQKDYLKTLKNRLYSPFLGNIPHLLNWKIQNVGKYINLNLLL